MNNTNASAVVIPLPTARSLPHRTPIFQRCGRRFAVTVVEEMLHGQRAYYVVSRNIWNDSQTIVGPLASQIDALKQGREQVAA